MTWMRGGVIMVFGVDFGRWWSRVAEVGEEGGQACWRWQGVCLVLVVKRGKGKIDQGLTLTFLLNMGWWALG